MKVGRITAALLVLSLMGQPPAFGEVGEKEPVAGRAEGSHESSLAGVLTAANIPMRGVACGLTGVLALVVMTASGGARYGLAADIMRDGCSGPWIITPEMLKEETEDQKSAQAHLGQPRVFTKEPVQGYPVPERAAAVLPAPAAGATRPPSVAGVTPGGEVVVEQTITVGGRPTRVGEKERVVFSEIAFQFDSAELTDLGKGQAYLAAQKLKENREMIVVIEGHADYVGSEEYNHKLGLRRAQTVINELAELGVDPARMSAATLGESRPLIGLETDWARAVNRRVEFRVVSFD
ncbi:MAG: OmpA family protein [Deltaproteobacteria bacterium]|nr:OmpA family protein [Deltaproteobacteria bacterium]